MDRRFIAMTALWGHGAWCKEESDQIQERFFQEYYCLKEHSIIKDTVNQRTWQVGIQSRSEVTVRTIQAPDGSCNSSLRQWFQRNPTVTTWTLPWTSTRAQGVLASFVWRQQRTSSTRYSFPGRMKHQSVCDRGRVPSLLPASRLHLATKLAWSWNSQFSIIATVLGGCGFHKFS